MEDQYLRRRRAAPVIKHSRNKSQNEEGNKDDENEAKISPQLQPFSWKFCFIVLLVSRLISARYNIIHDCDETFNYWEPLHYLVHGEGFQTWEYSAEFGLRSYLYLLLHSVPVYFGKIVFGETSKKFFSFYILRSTLGIFSAFCESHFVSQVGEIWGRKLGAYFLLLLTFSAGTFTASTTFLPSTFSMYFLALSSSLAIVPHDTAISVGVAAWGVLIGWPFALLASLPGVALSLATGKFSRVFLSGVFASISAIVLSVLADRYLYGRWLWSTLNLVRYNVLGGGDSGLYGVEGPYFYLRNLALNFNLALPLALLSPLLFLLPSNRPNSTKLAVSVGPFFLWLGFMSLQAHKEERFMYVVYPHLCLSAAIFLDSFPDLLIDSLKGRKKIHTVLKKAGIVLKSLLIGAMMWLSFARTSAVLSYYSAPMEIYKYLPDPKDLPNGTSTLPLGTPFSPIITAPKKSTPGPPRLCLGSEWHRFPSHFLLNSPQWKLGFLDDGFRGLLPFPFPPPPDGTSSAPKHFNSLNVASPGQFVCGNNL